MVLVGVMSYATAFTETLTISSFPYYSFEDRDMAYVVGSAFYGIYFIVRCVAGKVFRRLFAVPFSLASRALLLLQVSTSWAPRSSPDGYSSVVSLAARVHARLRRRSARDPD